MLNWEPYMDISVFATVQLLICESFVGRVWIYVGCMGVVG